MTQQSLNTFCHACGAALMTHARFCSQCGVSVSEPRKRISLSPKSLLLLSVSAVVVATGVWYVSGSIIGKKPSLQHAASSSSNGTDPHAGASGESVAQLDPEIAKLQEAVAKNPNDMHALQTLTRTLWNKLVDIPNPPASMILDLVDSLGVLLKMDPNNGEALLMMANLSFNQKVFDKSADYFARYLAIKNDDFEARASYASTLTFMGRHTEALKEIDKVLATQPNYFQAIAYKAITYAQMGKKAEAIELGQKALGLSPNEEAKARFAGFLDSLQNAADENTPVAPRGASSSDAATDFVRGHSIAGPKFVKGSLGPDGTVVIVLKEFPMSAMPPVVKDSFLAKLKNAASADSRIKKVSLTDADTSAELATIEIGSK